MIAIYPKRKYDWFVKYYYNEISNEMLNPSSVKGGGTFCHQIYMFSSDSPTRTNHWASVIEIHVGNFSKHFELAFNVSRI